MSEKIVPEGYNTVMPYIMVKDVAKLLDFLKVVFDAVEMERMSMPDGSVGHAEARIGDSVLMMGGAREEWPESPAGLYIYVSDTDATYNKAIAAGAESVMEPADQFYGDRNAGVKDPFGNTWWIATRKENLSQEELQKRHEERFSN